MIYSTDLLIQFNFYLLRKAVTTGSLIFYLFRLCLPRQSSIQHWGLLSHLTSVFSPTHSNTVWWREHERLRLSAKTRWLLTGILFKSLPHTNLELCSTGRLLISYFLSLMLIFISCPACSGLCRGCRHHMELLINDTAFKGRNSTMQTLTLNINYSVSFLYWTDVKKEN